VSLRRRFALLSAAAVAITVLLASALVYALVRDRLLGDIDDELRQGAERSSVRLEAILPALAAADPEEAARLPPPPTGGPPPGQHQVPAGLGGEDDPNRGFQLAVPPEGPGAPPALAQVIGSSGAIFVAPGSPIELPVSEADRQLAAGGGETRLANVEADGTELRVLTQPLGDGAALQVARSLEDTEETLSTLIVILVLVSAGGIALAAALGPVVARTALAPAADISAAAEEVARTQDLTRRIKVQGDDELGRLAASFNEMMAALERSQGAQRRLVSDASHELRTPLTTLRTDIETLGRGERVEPAERQRLVEDVTGELEEMGALVADVVELAREPTQGDELSRRDVALDELARDAIERARRRARGLTFEQRIAPSLIHADPERVGRAISNMLDNACKWSPSDGRIDVEVAGGRVTVRDRGPGFAEQDLPRVFDRFWRSDEARGKPGSGLGLAIVQRVAEEHGGAVRAANAEGGGAKISLELPEVPAERPSTEANEPS
jgi:two-component system, OmpR family, sensor histidine kinase MprB